MVSPKGWPRRRWVASGLIVALSMVVILTYPWWLSVWHVNRGWLELNAALLDEHLSAPERERRLVRAGAAFQRALQWNPRNGWAYHNLGVIYQNGQDYPAAAEAFSLAVALNPGDVNSAVRLGEVYLALGREPAAIKVYRQANLGFHLVAQGRQRMRNGDRAQAESLYRLAIEVDPDRPEAFAALGELYAEQGKTDEAITAYRSAIEREREGERRYLWLGQTYRLQGRWAEAIAAYRQVIARDPRNVRAYAEIGWILYYGQRQPQAAISQLEQAVRMAPGYLWNYVTLGQIYADLGDCGQAGEWFGVAERLRPGDWLAADLHATLGACHHRQGQEKEAIAQWQQAIRLRPEPSWWYHFQLGEVYRANGQYRPAIEEYQQVLELDPTNERARSRLAELWWSAD